MTRALILSALRGCVLTAMLTLGAQGADAATQLEFKDGEQLRFRESVETYLKRDMLPPELRHWQVPMYYEMQDLNGDERPEILVWVEDYPMFCTEAFDCLTYVLVLTSGGLVTIGKFEAYRVFMEDETSNGVRDLTARDENGRVTRRYEYDGRRYVAVSGGGR